MTSSDESNYNAEEQGAGHEEKGYTETATHSYALRRSVRKPLANDGAKGTNTRRVKAQKSRPQNSRSSKGEDKLIMAARAKNVERVAGICWDMWNAGWIATWRENRVAKHRHFSANKHGFMESRMMAIECRYARHSTNANQSTNDTYQLRLTFYLIVTHSRTHKDSTLSFVS
eukprot:GHVT01087741.1.p1 GENE.GHVT01087741.1~~GHVT01087741.1.p1  ORF type:complete len:172 (-),score=7.18 GHVT01087741.1:196-711(-)